jgi:hypothetical protein
MKYDWDGRTGEEPTRKFAFFPMILAAIALIVVAAYLLLGSAPALL